MFTFRIAVSFVFFFFVFPAHSQPALWQINKGNMTSYVFGTMHVGDDSMKSLPSHVTQAILKSDSVIVELDITTLSTQIMQQKVLPRMTLPSDTNLAKEISPQLYTKLATALEEFGLPIEQVSQIKPWAIALNLTSLTYQRAGFSSQYGADLQVIAFAKKHAIALFELETVDEQFGFFDEIGIDNNYLLLETLKSYKDLDGYVYPLVNAWKSGDLAALETQYDKAFTQDETSLRAEQVLLTNRNHRWIKALLPKLEKQTVFIAVGALHLPKDNGLLNLLQQQGYSIKKIEAL
ncbi:hypothetical protein PALB_10590 [Pseudoalteromonas luteoviolacea B = ATCC 29581]|nr:hypothetical protein PALB_10590 [Pseudoalteromonas luteoviolacea B = ATCC 29581]